MEPSYIFNVQKGESKLGPKTGHKNPEGKYMYSSTLSLTSALEDGWVVNATPRSPYPQENDPMPII